MILKMMTNLLLEEGSTVLVENVSLRVAEYVKLQPQSVDFLDISNPKAVLEKALRLFACLTVNDIISINYNKKTYDLSVLELKPDNAVSIIECDMNVSYHLRYLVSKSVSHVQVDFLVFIYLL